MSLNVLNWHAQAWSRLISDLAKLPHALLFQGVQGIGKLSFARALAATLLCERPGDSGASCGTCSGCRWLVAGTHPDFREIQPEALRENEETERSGDKKPSTQIGVDQIRELAGFINVSTHRQGAKVVLLHPAETLNANAANALLKSLEEPPPQTYFLLVTHRFRSLLPTIVSRCRQIPLAAPNTADAERFLQDKGLTDPGLSLAQAGGAPLAALELDDPDFWSQRKELLVRLAASPFIALAAADRIRDLPVPRLVAWLQKWSFDLMLAGTLGAVRYNPDFSQQIVKLAGTLQAADIARFHRSLLRLQRIVNHPLNPQLFAESLMIAYDRLLCGNIADAEAALA